jgi:hypothetical protein
MAPGLVSAATAAGVSQMCSSAGGNGRSVSSGGDQQDLALEPAFMNKRRHTPIQMSATLLR